MVDQDAWHPELLDWLAGEFVRGRYDIGHLLAVITTSRAYQLPTQSQNADYVFRGPSRSSNFENSRASFKEPGEV